MRKYYNIKNEEDFFKKVLIDDKWIAAIISHLGPVNLHFNIYLTLLLYAICGCLL